MKQFLMDGFLKGGKLNSQSSNNNKTQKEKNASKTSKVSKPKIEKPSKHKIIDDDSQEDPDINPNVLPPASKEPKIEIKLTSKNEEKSLPFSVLIDVLVKVENSKGENSKDNIKTLFGNLFKEIITKYPNDFTRVYYFLLSKVGPTYRSPEYGIGNGILEKVVSKVIGISENQIKEKMKEVGDLAIVASEGKKSVQTMDKFTNFIKVGPKKELTLLQVMNIYQEIASKKGKSSQDEKMKLLCKIMFQANKDEIKFIIRSLQKSLKIGASKKTIVFSLARGISQLLTHHLDEKEISKILMESISQLSDEDIVFKHIKELITSQGDFRKLTELCKITPGIPVDPQLARPTNGINVIFKRFENIPFTCEYKYDGFRGQIHYHNGITEVFSRNLENMTQTFPDIVEYVNNFKKMSDEKNTEKPLTSFIIDCEMVAFDKVKNKILPFQQLTTRSRKNVDISQITIHVCMFCFDILYLNDEILTKKTLRERREILYNTFTESEYIQFAKNLSSDNTTEIENFMTESIAAGCEGLIIKAIDKNSEYMPAQRNFNWLKLKKDYLDTTIGDSIDLVVIGASYGKGKRVGLYGSFLLACYNDDSETYESVTMTGGGLKDDDLDKFYKELQSHIIPKPQKNYRLGTAEADVYFDPYMVWEVKTADLTLSPIYTAGADLIPEHRGISLRFSRFIRLRPDKTPEEAVTSEYIVKLYKEQASITNNSKELKGMDDLDDIY